MARLGGMKEVSDNQNSVEIDELARFAVQHHNEKQNGALEFVKVVNAKHQVVSGTLYNLTVEAKNGEKNEQYETKIWVKPWMNFKEVQEFKPVASTS